MNLVMSKKKNNRVCARFTVSVDTKLNDDLDRYMKVVAKKNGHATTPYGLRSQVVQKALRHYLHMQAAEVRF
jgi:hypothetical protein